MPGCGIEGGHCKAQAGHYSWGHGRPRPDVERKSNVEEERPFLGEPHHGPFAGCVELRGRDKGGGGQPGGDAADISLRDWVE